MSYLPTALTIQLFLTFFAPPIAVGPRLLFVSDFWCLLWTGALLFVEHRRLKGIYPFLAATAALVAVSYVHGAYRPFLRDTLKYKDYFFLFEDDTFQGGRELIVAVRFLSWLWAGRVVAAAFAREKDARPALRSLGLALAACLVLSGALLALAKGSHGVEALLGRIYGYDPNYEYWRGRAYGAFRSPLEAGVSMGLGGLALLGFREISLRARLAGAALAGVGLACTKTLTTVVAAVIAIVLTLSRKYRRRLLKRDRTAMLTAAVGLVAIAVAVWLGRERLATKLLDVKFRWGPWVVYWEAAAKRPDLLLFGFGMAPYHTDNFFVWVFTRTGLVGLGAFLVWGWRTLVRGWDSWDRAAKASVVFLLVGTAMLDVLIYRNVVALLLAALIPLMARRSQDSPRRAGR
ncbi:MAG: hypothetical protein HY075_08070 [Deltaproteobacteria bacterium]|nr:hypothetical protein [Deltaproteobacteria bacterium]